MPDSSAIARRTLTVFYVLDSSGSMSVGGKIGTLNEAMRETVAVLAKIAEENADAEMKIGILEFSSGSKWVTEKPMFVKDFYWNNLEAGGLTDLGDALTKLDKKLSREEFMASDTGQYKPVIIFMSDGAPVDDYESALKKIKKNNLWYQAATKIAFAVGDDADTKVLANVVGNPEAVVKTTDLAIFKKMIKFVSIGTALANGNSHINGDDVSSGGIVDDAWQNTGIDPGGNGEKVQIDPLYIEPNEEPDPGEWSNVDW